MTTCKVATSAMLCCRSKKAHHITLQMMGLTKKLIVQKNYEHVRKRCAEGQKKCCGCSQTITCSCMYVPHRLPIFK